MTVAMLVVVAVQVNWLESSAKLRKEVFDQSVEQSLQIVATWLTAGHLDEVRSDDRNLLRTDELAPEERMVVRRMESFPMDSLLTIAFKEQGINAVPVFGAFNRYGQPVFLPEDAEDLQDELLSPRTGYSVTLGTLQFRVHFPRLPRYLMGQMLGAFALSVVMMLLIAAIFAHTLVAIQRTKRLDRLQRDLVNNLTHELKTPISSIGLASEALADPSFDDTAKKHYLSLIREENKRLGVLVENVLRASLSESGAMRLYMQPLNVHDLVKNVVKNMAMRLHKQGAKVELDLTASNPNLMHYLSLIREENKRLGVLVENVLRASLSESGAMRLYMQPLNVHDLVKNVVKNMAMRLHKQGAKVELDLTASNPNLMLDRIHVTNVLFNLIDNAMKYAKEDPHIVIHSEQTPDGLSLHIQDNGIGIAKEHLGKVFERLYRVPTGNVHNVKGFGLGLSYVKNVLEHHGGSVHIASQPGEGTTLTLNLPFEQSDKTEAT